MGRSNHVAEPPAGVVAGASAVGCLPFGRRTCRRGKGHDRDRRGAMRAVGDVALPRRRRSVCRRHAFGIAGRPAVRSVAPRMAGHSGRFPRSSGQCTSGAAGLTGGPPHGHAREPGHSGQLLEVLGCAGHQPVDVPAACAFGHPPAAGALVGVPLVTERIWSLLVGRAVSKCKVGRGVIGGCVVQQQFHGCEGAVDGGSGDVEQFG